MKRAIIGYGGHAREAALQMNEEFVFFVDDEYVDDNTLPLSSFDAREYEVMIAIGSSHDRLRMQSKLPEETRYFTFIHPTALILDKNVSIGEGSFIGAYSIITTNVKIGKHCILNRACHIGHDCEVGDYLSMMPGSIISGNCILGSGVYMGTNSSIREKTTVCDNVVIGLNAGVVDDITHSGVYIKTPAKKLGQ